MKLGIFDSGLGGILITRAIRALMPELDIIYLGDTLHVPYGNRSEDTIYAYTERCIDRLFEADCQLIIVACNTASASALRKLQQGYLRERYPLRRVLGVVVPTIEVALDTGHERLGLIGTNYTLRSQVYAEELRKLSPRVQLFQTPAPLLVPLIEQGGMKWIPDILEEYLAPLLAENIDAVLLGCTHYVCLKDMIRARYGIDVISQDEIIPLKLQDYLRRHPETSTRLSRAGQAVFWVTDITENYIQTASELYGEAVDLEKIAI